MNLNGPPEVSPKERPRGNFEQVCGVMLTLSLKRSPEDKSRALKMEFNLNRPAETLLVRRDITASILLISSTMRDPRH